METAIKKAIEGGWKYQNNHHTDETPKLNGVKVYLNDADDTKLFVLKNDLLLDPLFWQALGKAEGWHEHTGQIFHPMKMTSRVTRKGVQKYTIPAHTVTRRYKTFRWKKEWHRFIDHLALGKSPDDFFTNLFKE